MRPRLWCVPFLFLVGALGAEVRVVSNFPEASPVGWGTAADGSLRITLMRDRERDSPNTAGNHWHFALEGTAGAAVTLVLEGTRNIYNGKPTSALGPHAAAWIAAEDGEWRPVPLARAADGQSATLRVMLPLAGRLRVARLPVYGLAELDGLLKLARAHPAATFTEIGRSVEGRSLVLLSLGSPTASRRVLIRARAHPWEAGGSWVMDALVRALLADTEANRRLLARVAFDLVPMANPDGVAAGRSRFNAAGVDLNRRWLESADPKTAPENAALEAWLRARQATGVRHDFFLDLHNDNYGKIHTGRAPGNDADHAALVARYEALLRRHTWFTEGVVNKAAGNPGTSADGMAVRFGVPGVVQELNADWIAGRGARADVALWREFGAALPAVLAELVDGGP